MERLRISACEPVGYMTVRMPIETPTGVTTWRDCKAVSVFGRVFQVESISGGYRGTDLATLEEVLLDLE